MTSTQPAANTARISRIAVLRGLMTAGVIALGVAAVHGLEVAMHATFDKPPAPLSRPLSLMSKQLGSPVTYQAIEPDGNLEPTVVEALGTTDYLTRRYRNLTIGEGKPGSVLNLNINYYPTGSSTPHVPEICWVGTGREEVGNSRKFFDVSDVPRKDGSRINLRMRMISFAPLPSDARAIGAAESGEPVSINVAYVFHVNGEYVATPKEVTSLFWKATNRYAYHAKIEVTPTDSMGRPMACTQKQAMEVISDLMRAALPELERCLPDPAILTTPAKGPISAATAAAPAGGK